VHVTVDPTDLRAGLNHARGARARPRAIELAYDDTFGDACRALQGFEPPMRLDWLARVQAEVCLAVRGLTW
jgi:hypothetical protein